MNRYTCARWFNRRPRWLRDLVYELTGWQVIRTTITGHHSAGLFAYTTERTTYSWTRARKVRR